MEVIDNVNRTLKDDLLITVNQNSRISIASACFSIFAYQELKKQFDNIEELRFIFTSPAFVAEKAPKEKREFYIPQLNRERSLYGTDFEIKLRNELSQKMIARECAEWIRSKVEFRSNVTGGSINSMLNVVNQQSGFSYSPVNAFTTTELGCQRGDHITNLVTKISHEESTQYIQMFEQVWNDKSLLKDVTDDVIESITAAYNENSPDFLYFITLYNIFNEFLEDISEDVLPNEATGFKESNIWNMLYSFQKDAALAVINKLEKYNGCILADSVGLGKTFTALAVMKYYENRNRSVLVLCPKKLSDNWNTFKDNYVNNPIAGDRLRYDVLYHTDLSREKGKSNGLDLDRLVWNNYDLIVIDESHNFRNGGEISGKDARENRYLRLLNKVIRSGVKTKVLMLSATPVNNRFADLKNQLELAYEGNPHLINDKLNTSKSVDEIFRNAQRAFNFWGGLEPEERTTEKLLKMLDFDFFELLDSVTIARSRKHIEKYYNMAEIGAFPERLKPISLRPQLTDIHDVNYNKIYEELVKLNLSVYTPTNYVFPSKLDKYVDSSVNINRSGREEGIRRLMSINLLKRLESSVSSFRLTLGRIQKLIHKTISEIDEFEAGGISVIESSEVREDTDFDLDDQNTDFFSGRKIKIDLNDMDYKTWRAELQNDFDILETLGKMADLVTPEHDTKLQTLLQIISEKIENPINVGNKKVIVFSAFSDTAEYLYENVSVYLKQKYDLNTALITGSIDGKTTIPKFKPTFNNVLTCFSPLSKGKDLLMPDFDGNIDVLIATDCISEGQNLQDCDFLVNYDIHWNPVRIIQRFGRIDRIGSKNAVIQLVNFWPDLTLDEYINLKSRVETRMKISVMTSTGDDDLINSEEKGDLEYRKAQLKRLQDEVVDIEEMSSGISIMDLGLNEFRLDLLEYSQKHGDLDKTPFGLHTVVSAQNEYPAGVIFILKNINGGVNIDNQNRLHPFYMIYLADDGNVICNHLSPKEMLDTIRYLSKGQTQPDVDLCRSFNTETKDGKDMSHISELLQDAIHSIVSVKEENDIASLFKSGGTSALNTTITGLDDFELICFFVVRNE
ncbi:RNA polymerase-associated protein RapA [Methanimicrococcus sp. At1]|uniref:RNA polymerase-associated protein RapA n=1 Tax=Methanimicrococcus hacksteinii TaxID=3028293 RepID=A0ABU3VN10_9EURY|nr:helicase-related protein [Methanimicrococcus sp. At1]MDV0444798.1 RNA polymerase-associated protein RapA [Methanimicrococcus sp. At1]